MESLAWGLPLSLCQSPPSLPDKHMSRQTTVPAKPFSAHVWIVKNSLERSVTEFLWKVDLVEAGWDSESSHRVSMWQPGFTSIHTARLSVPVIFSLLQIFIFLFCIFMKRWIPKDKNLQPLKIQFPDREKDWKIQKWRTDVYPTWSNMRSFSPTYSYLWV